MWATIGKLLKKVGNYAIIGFSGYEVGNKIVPHADTEKTEIVIKTEKEKTGLNIEHLILVLIIMIVLAFVIVSVKQLIKCINNCVIHTPQSTVETRNQNQNRPTPSERQA